MAHRVWNVNMRNHAKYRGNRSNMVEISRFSNFKIAAIRHLGFLNIQNFNGRQSYEGERASSYAKFHGNRCNCCRDMAIFRFFKMASAAIFDF